MSLCSTFQVLNITMQPDRQVEEKFHPEAFSLTNGTYTTTQPDTGQEPKKRGYWFFVTRVPHGWEFCCVSSARNLYGGRVLLLAGLVLSFTMQLGTS